MFLGNERKSRFIMFWLFVCYYKIEWDIDINKIVMKKVVEGYIGIVDGVKEFYL